MSREEFDAPLEDLKSSNGTHLNGDQLHARLTTGKFKARS